MEHVLRWNHDSPFAFCFLYVIFEVCLSTLSHLFEVALVEVSQHQDAGVEALHVLFEVEAVLGELGIILGSGTEQDCLLDFFVELGDTCTHLLEGYCPFLQHLHVLLTLDG